MNADITIIRRPVKHARLRVSEDGSVRLIAPKDFEPDRIAGILTKKESWIRQNQDRFAKRSSERPTFGVDQVVLHGEILSVIQTAGHKAGVKVDLDEKVLRIAVPSKGRFSVGDAIRLYAARYLCDRADTLSKHHNLSYNRLFIRSQRTKWGNCSHLKNVSLNWRLVQLSDFISDYVIVHELLHTRIMNHGDRFWVTLRAIYPKTDAAVAWLHKNGSGWTA
jgi:predicted metal-dependent hydrolase